MDVVGLCYMDTTLNC